MAYASIAVEGGMFPSDLLDRLATGDLGGQRASDFSLPRNQRLTTEIQAAFSGAHTHWDSFQRRLLRSSVSRTTLTRQDWVPKLIEELGYQSLAILQGSIDAGGRSYSIYAKVDDDDEAPPFHIASIDRPLDSRVSRSTPSPHATVQDYLNNSDALWGIVTNGSKLRLLRHSARIARPTYVEFDVQGMIESNQYSEFSVLYRLLHRSRLPAQGDSPEDCLLERYFQQGIDDHSRVRDKLREGVERALRTLGTGFLAHEGSTVLRSRLQTGSLSAEAYYRQLLRLVYRLLFLMVAEERRLLYPNDTGSPGLHRVYDRYYSVTRLRERAERWFGDDRNSDLWGSLVQAFRLFRDDDVASVLGLRALDGELFGAFSCPDLEAAHCTNQVILEAILDLSTFTDDDNVRRRVNYAGIDVEEFGSVYESLLEFHPRVDLTPQPSFNLVYGSGRKETGSYYTPPELVHELVESALVPVMTQRLEGARSKQDKVDALLELNVCDPAAGSGHFLLAAARRIAREVAQLRTGEGEPSPSAYRTALRDTIRSCIYAVDKNPLAVDLCKVALWIEGHEPGLPLSFLDGRIKCGDSLVGVNSIDVLRKGIPDDAYKVILGDDKSTAAELRKRNREEIKGWVQLSLGTVDAHSDIIRDAAIEYESLSDLDEVSAADVRAKGDLYEQLRGDRTDWYTLKVACDLWTAAFFMPKQSTELLAGDSVPTTGTIRRWIENRALDGRLTGMVAQTASDGGFFHWPLEFPDVFDEQGGFDVILGNPPWETMQPEEKKFFAIHDPRIANLPGQTRKQAIKNLNSTDPQLERMWEGHRRSIQSFNSFVKGSTRFPLGSFGKIRTHTIFAELAQTCLAAKGRAGIIVPTGIATDDSSKKLFISMVEAHSLVSLYDFENREQAFPGVDSRQKFCLMTTTGSGIQTADAEFAFYLHQTGQLKDENRRFRMSEADFRLFNPNTRTCPIFRTPRDASITQKLYRRASVLIDERLEHYGNPWGIRLMQMFNMTSDSGLFKTRRQLEIEGGQLEQGAYSLGGERYLPLYEAKLFHQYDHRFATFDGVSPESIRGGNARQMTPGEKADPETFIVPRYWVPAGDVSSRLGKSQAMAQSPPPPEDPILRHDSTHRQSNRRTHNLRSSNPEDRIGTQGSGYRNQEWIQVLRLITTATNERTTIASVIPSSGLGHKGAVIALPPGSSHSGKQQEQPTSGLVSRQLHRGLE